MNRLAIFLNNQAVDAMKVGYPYQAFEMLSDASDAMFKQMNCRQGDSGFQRNKKRRNLGIPSSRVFSFSWQDCSNAQHGELPDQIKSQRGGGNSQLLCLHLFHIHAACNENDLEEYDVKDFVWVIFYNLATLCSFFGTLLGERGVKLLQRARTLYQKTRQCLPRNSNLIFPALHLALWNNQACTLCDLGDMGSCRKLASALAYATSILGNRQQQRQNNQGGHNQQQIPVSLLDSFQLASLILSQKYLIATAA